MRALLVMMTCGGLAAVSTSATGQATKAAQQVVKPPVAQAWIDVATFSGMGMGMGMGGAANPMAAIAGMFGGGRSGQNTFGLTKTGSAGRYVDVTLYSSRNPGLAEALQAVPTGTQLAPTLKLLAPVAQKAAPRPDDESVEQPDYERPKGKMLLYWGCGEAVRAGQPRVVDFATAAPADFQKFFIARRATQRGAHSAAGRPHWPNRDDARAVPDSASLAGEHGFSGQGVPDGFRFSIPAAQDIMPAIELAQREAGGATQLEWKALPTTRGYFIAAMGAREGAAGGGGGDGSEMVFWTSSEQPDTGMGLVEYQTNAAVDRWLKEKVLLEPSVTRCAVPKGIFGEGAMLRMIAYGNELNLAHPPRPADPKMAWEPQWAVKIRVKSVASAMLGVDMNEMPGGGRRPAAAEADRGEAQQDSAQKDEDKKPGAIDVLRGIFGR
jgi:hypothetical protein